MKLLDRYILRTFLVPLVVCGVAFNLFFVIYDLFDNFDLFVDAKANLREVLTYYAFLLPPNFWIIMPIVLLLSVLFALYQLTRHNELTAMRASGISLYRLLVPYVIVGLLVALAVGYVDETVGPEFSQNYNEMIYGFKGRNEGGVSKAGTVDPPPHILREILFFNESTGRDWYIAEMDSREETHFRLEGVRISKKYEGTQEYEFRLEAASPDRPATAEYRGGEWIFSDVRFQRYKPGLVPMKAETYEGDVMFKPGFEEPPLVFAKVDLEQENQYMSALQIHRFLRETGDNIKPEVRTRLEAEMHSRLARPLGCFIATLLGIPFGFQTARKGIFAGVLICFGAFFSYYAVFIFSMYLGKAGVLPAALGGWLPNLVYTTIGVILFRRMRQ